jgi:carboxyl-terminal processing protease
LWTTGKYYVEPERIDAARMTLMALEGLETQVPEVMVRPLAGGERVEVTVNTRTKTFPLASRGIWEVSLRLREVFEFVQTTTLLTPDQARAAEYALIDGATETLDPHTILMRPEALEDMNTSTKGSFGGLGIEIGTRDEMITVLRVLEGTPAAAAGLRAGDRIVQVDDQSTVALTISDAIGLLKGPPKSSVVVFVRREGHERPLRYEMTRAIIRIESVSGEILPAQTPDGEPAKVGLVQISRTFAKTTGAELREQLQRFEDAGVSAVVLDMRNNSGGLLDAAVEVADAFLSQGVVVSTVGAASLPKVERATEDFDFPELPVVVLVDQGSASATEIVAGALRNHDRAVIVGRRTFGKGSVQVLYDRRVDDRELGLKLTRAQYLTPGNVSIQSVGVSPDLETMPVNIGKQYSIYYGRQRFDRLREESLAEHLDHETAQTQEIAAGPVYFLQRGSLGVDDPADNRSSVRTGEQVERRVDELLADPELRLARDLAMWMPSPDRQMILEDLPRFAAEQNALEDARIVASLAKKDVDWSPPPASPPTAQLKVEVAVDGEDPSAPIRAGTRGTLTMRVTNVGEEPAYRVRAVSRSDYSWVNERELLIGKLAPGETRAASLSLPLGASELSRRDYAYFDVIASGEVALAEDSTTRVVIGTEALQRPSFAFGYQVIDDPAYGEEIAGNGNGMLEVGESALLRVWGKNRGPARSERPAIWLRNRSGGALFMHRGRARLSAIEPGAAAEDRFPVDLRKPPRSDGLRMQIAVYDSRVGEYLSEEVVLPYGGGSGDAGSNAGPVLRPSEQRVRVPAGAILRATAAQTAAPVAIVRESVVLRADRSGEGWHRVHLPKANTFAFVLGAEPAPDATAAAAAPLSPGIAITPPEFRVDPLPSETADDSIVVSGVATDETSVRDVWVDVYNPARDPRGRAQKIAYQASERPGTALEFSADVPLQAGNNLIEIRARDGDDVVNVTRRWVLRTSGLAE